MKLDDLYQKLEKKATWAIILTLFVACLFCVLGFGWRNKTLALENPTLDSRFYNGGRFLYSPTEVSSLFTELGAEKRQLYAITELTLDVIFPLLYVSLLTFLLIRLFSANIAKYLILLPIVGGIFDLLENSTIAFLAFTFNHQPSNIAYFAAIFTLLKWVLLVSCLLILISKAIWILGKSRND